MNMFVSVRFPLLAIALKMRMKKTRYDDIFHILRNDT